MLNLREIYKPKMLDAAIKLLQQPDTVALAGGTELVAHPRKEIRAVVDLSDLGLAYIRDANGAIAIGATTTLAEVADSPMLRAVANGVIAQAAHRTHASILRNQATVAGTLITEPDGIFATVLCAMEVILTLALPRKTSEGIALADFFARREEFLRGGLVTGIEISATSFHRRAVIEAVARTPRDKPIVVVCATREVETNTVTLAVGGVSDYAQRFEIGKFDDAAIEKAVRAAMNVNVTRDDPSAPLRTSFLGSADYRREMAGVLVKRALEQLT